MKPQHLYAVEFVGGPLDGHKHVGFVPPHERAETLELPLNAAVLGVLNGARHVPSRPITSVAWYTMHSDWGVCRYHYMGSTAPSERLAEPSRR